MPTGNFNYECLYQKIRKFSNSNLKFHPPYKIKRSKLNPKKEKEIINKINETVNKTKTKNREKSMKPKVASLRRYRNLQTIN